MARNCWLLPLIFALAACEAYPEPYDGEPYPAPYPAPPPYPPASPYPPEPYPPAPYPGGPASYRAIGTEPFWDLEIGGELVFTDRGMDLVVRQPAPLPIATSNGETWRTPRIQATITKVRCSDGMSDRTYPDTVEVLVDGRRYRGCGAPTAWFSSVDERGNPIQPAPGLAPPLERTRWRVIAINGRPTPPAGDFGMDFENGRISARFGCNRLGGSYAQAGATLTVRELVTTEMACPDMSFESQGGAILRQRLTIRLLDPNRISLANATGTIELARR